MANESAPKPPEHIHECGVEVSHKICTCVTCGESFPNNEYHPPEHRAEKEAPKPPEVEEWSGRRNISVLIACGDRKFRVIDNLRELVGGEGDRCLSEARIGRKVLDLARTLEVGNG